jgi:hypothetical protein
VYNKYCIFADFVETLVMEIEGHKPHVKLNENIKVQSTVEPENKLSFQQWCKRYNVGLLHNKFPYYIDDIT